MPVGHSWYCGLWTSQWASLYGRLIRAQPTIRLMPDLHYAIRPPVGCTEEDTVHREYGLQPEPVVQERGNRQTVIGHRRAPNHPGSLRYFQLPPCVDRTLSRLCSEIYQAAVFIPPQFLSSQQPRKELR